MATLLQSKILDSAVDAETVTVTLDATATLGNVLVALVAVDKQPSSVGTITGFSVPVVINSGTSSTLAYSFKTSDGTENSFTATWVEGAGREGALWVGELSAADPTPEVVAVADSGNSVVTSQTTGTTLTTTGDGIAIAGFSADTGINIDNGRAYTNGFAEDAFIGGTGSGQNKTALIVATSQVGTQTVESTFSTTANGDQMCGCMLVFKDDGSPPVIVANIDFYLANAEATTVKIKCRVPSGADTAIEYSVNSDFTASTTTVAVTPVVANDFIAEIDITGLTAGTQYFYRAIENVTGVDTRSAKFKTMQPAGTPQNMKFVFSGDADTNNNSNTFTNIANLTDIDFVFHLGDIHYDDITTNTEEAFFSGYRNVFSLTNQRNMFESHSLNYKWDDHDYGVNNSDGTNPAKVSAAAAYRKYFPNHTLNNVSLGTIESSWSHGRVRFIMLDTRYERANNTLLGTLQKDWFLTELENAAADPNIRFTVVSVGVPWISTSVSDTWSDAAAERTEIADKVFSEGLQDKIVFLCADAHMITHDDGTNNTFDTSAQTGWPIYHSAPLGRSGSTKGGPYSGTVFQGDIDGQYSTMEILDTGTMITVNVIGLDKNEATLYTHSFNFQTDPAVSTETIVNNLGAVVANKSLDYAMSDTFAGATTDTGTVVSDVNGLITINGNGLGEKWVRIRDPLDENFSAVFRMTFI